MREKNLKKMLDACNKNYHKALIINGLVEKFDQLDLGLKGVVVEALCSELEDLTYEALRVKDNR